MTETGKIIRTKRIKPTKKNLFSVLLIRYIKKRWWLYAWIWILAIILLFDNNYNTFHYFFWGLALVYPFIMLGTVWSYVHSENSRLILSEMHYEIDSNRIKIIIDEDTTSSIKMEHFIRAEIIKDIYLLFITKNQFIFIPVDTFTSKTDREWFREEVFNKINKRIKKK